MLQKFKLLEFITLKIPFHLEDIIFRILTAVFHCHILVNQIPLKSFYISQSLCKFIFFSSPVAIQLVKHRGATLFNKSNNFTIFISLKSLFTPFLCLLKSFIEGVQQMQTFEEC